MSHQLALTLGCQRWRRRRASYRPAGEPFDPRRFEAEPIAEDTPVKAFVEEHHYSGSYPAARERVGLYRNGRLVGVAVFSVPAHPAVLARRFGENPAVELGRFVLLDRVRANAETWFLGRCFDLLRERGYVGVLSFSDPVPRRDGAGLVTFPGHVGTIYQAHNARYLGRARARTLRLLPDATVFSDRAASKIRAGHRGWRSAALKLVRYGAPPPPVRWDDDPEAGELAPWLEAALAATTRPLRHGGNHTYAWRLDIPRFQVIAANPTVYPKQPDPLPA